MSGNPSSLTEPEQDALLWLITLGMPVRSSNPRADAVFRRLCGKGYAKVRFMHGEFYYEAKVIEHRTVR